MSMDQNQISLIDVANSTDEQFANIMAKVDAMTEDQSMELLESLINEFIVME